MDQGWASLPEHLAEVILERLKSLKDYLIFGSVCVSWHSTMRCNHRYKYANIWPHHEAPMLLIPNNTDERDEEDELMNTWCIYDPMNNRLLSKQKLSIPYAKNKRFCGSTLGWLAGVNKDYSLTLFKPYSMVGRGKESNNNDVSVCLPIMFPPIYDESESSYLRERYDHHVIKALITSDPVMDKENCTVVAMFTSCRYLVFFRLGEDETWNRLEAVYKGRPFSACDILFHHSHKKIYSVGYLGELFLFEPNDPSSTLELIETTGLSPFMFLPEYTSCGKIYLVESCQGDLLMVQRYFHYHQDIRVSAQFRIHKLNFDDRKWIELECLGDSAIFIGDNTSICVTASDYEGCKPNVIYATHDRDYVFNQYTTYDVGVYNLQTKTFDLHFNMTSAVIMGTTMQRPIFVSPPLN